MGLKDVFRKKVSADAPAQPRFFCSECKHEIVLQMKYCDGCGGEIKWPEKYTPLITCETKT